MIFAASRKNSVICPNFCPKRQNILLLLSYKKARHILEVKCGGLFPSFLFVFYPFMQLFCRAKRPSGFGGWPSFCSVSLTLQYKAQFFDLAEVLFPAGSCINTSCVDAAVPQQAGQMFQILLTLVEAAGKQMPQIMWKDLSG